MKSLFDKRFVHFMWDDELEGKEGFFADNINVLKSYVEDLDDNRVGSVSVSNRGDFPFCNSCGGKYRFFYWDPNYECRRAYAEGKPFQYKERGSEKWCYWNYSFSPKCSFSDDVEYRIPPKAEEPKSRPFEDTSKE